MTAAPRPSGYVAPDGNRPDAKLRRAEGPFAHYRQWYAGAPFGTADQFSAYVLSVGVSVPDLTQQADDHIGYRTPTHTSESSWPPKRSR